MKNIEKMQLLYKKNFTECAPKNASKKYCDELDFKAIDKKYHEALNKKHAQFPTDSAFNKFALQTFKQKVEELLSKQQY